MVNCQGKYGGLDDVCCKRPVKTNITSFVEKVHCGEKSACL